MCETETHTHRKVREKVQAGENERFERDCQNVAGGNVSSEVERSQTEPEQQVETIISVCESLRAAPCDVTGSPASVSTAEDKHGDRHVLTSDLSAEHAVLCSVLLLLSLQAPAPALMTSSLFVGSHRSLPRLSMCVLAPRYPQCISFIWSRARAAAA